jgi:hypothetical protein
MCPQSVGCGDHNVSLTIKSFFRLHIPIVAVQWLALLFHILEVRFQISVLKPDILAEVSCYPHSLQGKRLRDTSR